MSVILKCILGVFVVLCCVQFIEMARVRRDDVINDVTDTLQNTLNTFVDKLKGALDEETVKKIMDAATQSLAEGTKLAKDQLSKIAGAGTAVAAGGADGA